MKRAILLLFFLLSLFSATAQNREGSLTITQIENRRVAIDGTADLFFLLRSPDGEPRDIQDNEELALFTRPQSGDGKDGEYRQTPILSVRRNAPEAEGIHFLLLLDNSGSMHEEFIGTESRYQTALYALTRFLESIDNPLDRIGISAFNTYYTELSPIAPPDNAQQEAIAQLEEPSPDQAFTELYQAMRTGADALSEFPGRRALIVLSDGENYPYTLRNATHPEYGTSQVEPEELIRKISSVGVSVYAVHIGDSRDPALDRIAAASGGRGFGAVGREDLGSIYEEIRAEIQREYRVRFRHTYSGEGTSEVRLEADNLEAFANYTVPHFFGPPSEKFGYLLLLPVLIGIALLVFLILFRFERPVSQAELNLLIPGKRFSAATRVALSDQRTVIGRSDEADMTIAGNPALKASHATIVADKSGNYTVSAETEFRVNNRLTKERTLKSGDVIDFEGTTIVFDKPDTSR